MEYKSTRSKNVSGVSSAFAIKSGLAPDGGLYMRNASTGETVSGFRFAKTEGYLLREGIYQAAAVLAAVCSLWLAVRAIAFLLGLKLSKIQQNGLLAGGTAAVVAVVIVSQLLGQFESVYRDELMNRLHILASTVSGLVDGDSLEKIKTSEDYMGEDYQNLMDALDQALNQEDNLLPQGGGGIGGAGSYL